MELMLQSLPIALPMIISWWAISVAWRERARRSHRGVLMAYSWLYKGLAFGIMALLTALFATVLLPINRNIESLKSAAIGLGMLGAPTVWLVRETRRRKILVTSNELVSIRNRERWKRIRWRDVAAVTGGAFTGGFHVRSTDGGQIGVSNMLVGQKEFARMVLEKVPADRVHCKELLQRILEY